MILVMLVIYNNLLCCPKLSAMKKSMCLITAYSGQGLGGGGERDQTAQDGVCPGWDASL